MHPKGRTKPKLVVAAATALLALMIVPVLATAASAASIGPSGALGTSASGSWAYGGEGTFSASHSLGPIHYSLAATAGIDVILNATNTSANVTELTASRTIVVTVSESYSGPLSSWSYGYKLAEDDFATANITNAANVTLNGGSSVAALGLLNASLHGNVSLAAYLKGSSGGETMSDYLNASGWAKAHVSLSPALGIVPLNLSGVSGWHSMATASGSAAWNVTWSLADHGWNATTTQLGGSINGTWTTTTAVFLYGHVAGNSSRWSDHRVRTAIGLGLAGPHGLGGPFDLYAGVFLIPRGFDLFHGGSNAVTSAGLGSSTIASTYVYVSHRDHLTARATTAANLTTGSSTPSGATTVTAGANPAAGQPGTTVWAQPESPQAASSQAACMQYGTGCAGSSKPFGGLYVALAIAGVAAVVAVALLLGRKPRTRAPPSQRMDMPLVGTPTASPYPPTPPTGSPSGNGPASPPPS
jgi:hypothetical protein